MHVCRLASILPTLALASCAGLGAGPGGEPASTSPATSPRRVLFVGNSFTYYNDGLQNHVRRLLREAEGEPGSIPYRLRSLTLSGGRLVEQQDGLRAMVAAEPWDAVVLQGHSTVANSPEKTATFRSGVTTGTQLIRGCGATPALFMTWAYTGRPEMTKSLADAYRSVGAELGALVVPVGEAFARAGREHPEIVLRQKDRKHPTRAGTYLAACVFCSALFDVSPVGRGYRAGLPGGVARKLQKVAAQAVEGR